MKASDVTLSERAAALCRRFGILENHAKNARIKPDSTWEGREFLIVIGSLPDGRSVHMKCRYDRPEHIVTLRPLGRT